MKKKQKVKERNVRQLRQLIGAVAEQNGEEGVFDGRFRGSLTSRQGPLWPGTSLRHPVCRISGHSLLLPQIRSLGMEKARGPWK